MGAEPMMRPQRKAIPRAEWRFTAQLVQYPTQNSTADPIVLAEAPGHLALSDSWVCGDWGAASNAVVQWADDVAQSALRRVNAQAQIAKTGKRK